MTLNVVADRLWEVQVDPAHFLQEEVVSDHLETSPYQCEFLEVDMFLRTGVTIKYKIQKYRIYFRRIKANHYKSTRYTLGG